MKLTLRHEDTLQLDYEVQGSGPDVILLHGLGFSSRLTWMHQISALARSYRVHAYDMRGFGGSNNPSGRQSVEQHALDLLALMDAVGIEQACLIGFSMGGWISQQFVLDHPERVRALVLSATTSGLRPEGAARFVARSLKVESEGLEGLVEDAIASTFAPETIVRDPDLVDLYRREFLDPVRNPRDAYARMFRALTVPNWSAQLGRIQCPTLILCGLKDQGSTRGQTPTDAAEILHQGILGSRLEVFPDSGHYAHLEQPEVWNRVVLQFLGTLPL
jgi:pimeloyl-ACP methyl ester carboxylesterase